ncbi:hypothetical protein B0H14DRAFT_3444680 [Mycena olivaceomarginata]|nr:hypothetical protein B0H14DRAFT_3444680 [Mycena olivaceomarginata]
MAPGYKKARAANAGLPRERSKLHPSVLPTQTPRNPTIVTGTAPRVTRLAPLHTPTLPSPAAQSSPPVAVPDDIFTGYISDISSGDFSEIGGDKTSGSGNADGRVGAPDTTTCAARALSTTNDAAAGTEPIPHQVRPVLALKRQKFAVPQAERRRLVAIQVATARANILVSALGAIDKLIASKKDTFHAGNASLQSYRARSIQSHLHMVVKNQNAWKAASETAAEAQGFATKWGGRMVRKWTRNWISDRVIPESKITKCLSWWIIPKGIAGIA